LIWVVVSPWIIYFLVLIVSTFYNFAVSRHSLNLVPMNKPSKM